MYILEWINLLETVAAVTELESPLTPLAALPDSELTVGSSLFPPAGGISHINKEKKCLRNYTASAPYVYTRVDKLT